MKQVLKRFMLEKPSTNDWVSVVTFLSHFRRLTKPIDFNRNAVSLLTKKTNEFKGNLFVIFLVTQKRALQFLYSNSTDCYRVELSIEQNFAPGIKVLKIKFSSKKSLKTTTNESYTEIYRETSRLRNVWVEVSSSLLVSEIELWTKLLLKQVNIICDGMRE